jgi:hypothetical protein
MPGWYNDYVPPYLTAMEERPYLTGMITLLQPPCLDGIMAKIADPKWLV